MTVGVLLLCCVVQIMPAPANYKPIIDPARKLMATPTPMMTPFYAIPEENDQLKKDMPAVPEGLPEMKPEDMQYFSKLLQVRHVLMMSYKYQINVAMKPCTAMRCKYTVCQAGQH
jgi:hypothetical protein